MTIRLHLPQTEILPSLTDVSTHCLCPPNLNNYSIKTDLSLIPRLFRMAVILNLLKFYASLPVVMVSSSIVGYLFQTPTLRFWSRALTCYCSVLLCASYGIFASILLRIVGRPTLAQWTTGRSFALLTTRLIGLEWDIQGEEILAKTRPAVFISNHQRFWGY